MSRPLVVPELRQGDLAVRLEALLGKVRQPSQHLCKRRESPQMALMLIALLPLPQVLRPQSRFAFATAIESRKLCRWYHQPAESRCHSYAYLPQEEALPSKMLLSQDAQKCQVIFLTQFLVYTWKGVSHHRH